MGSQIRFCNYFWNWQYFLYHRSLNMEQEAREREKEKELATLSGIPSDNSSKLKIKLTKKANDQYMVKYRNVSLYKKTLTMYKFLWWGQIFLFFIQMCKRWIRCRHYAFLLELPYPFWLCSSFLILCKCYLPFVLQVCFARKLIFLPIHLMVILC